MAAKVQLSMLFYQDFNEQFEGYTQRTWYYRRKQFSCFIRISMNNLKDIHNGFSSGSHSPFVVLSGFQWTIWRIYTTNSIDNAEPFELFYQDFNEQFEGYTQQERCPPSPDNSCFIRISMNNLKDIHNHTHKAMGQCVVVLSGFQWTIWRIYTTKSSNSRWVRTLFYQDFNEQFEGYTQPPRWLWLRCRCCFIRISMNNLKDIHNMCRLIGHRTPVVLSGFQWTIWRIYTTKSVITCCIISLFYQDFNEQFEGYTQRVRRCVAVGQRCFIRISMNNLKDIHNWVG